jgi:hypothetical protein
MVELKDLYMGVTILLLVSLLVGLAVILMDKMGTATQLSTSVTDGTVNLSTNTRIMTYSPCLSLDGITDVDGEAKALTNLTINTSNPCVINGDYANTLLYNITYTYGRNTSATKSMDAVGTALGDISNLWLSLIVTLMVLSIIIAMVLRSFAVRSR